MIYLSKDFQNFKILKKEKKLTSKEWRKKLRERENSFYIVKKGEKIGEHGYEMEDI